MKDAQEGGRSGRLSLVVRVGVATAAILWVCRNQDWRELAEVFQRLSVWYFCLIVAIYAGTQVILAVRWWLLLRAQSICIGVRTAIRLFFLGLFYNNVMLGAVGGDVLKAWYVAKHTDKRLEGVLSVFVDRAVGLVGLVVMAVVAYVAFVRGPLVGRRQGQETGSPSGLVQYQSVLIWSGVVVAAALAAVLVHPYGRQRLRRAADGLRRRGLTLLKRVKDALVVYCSKPMTVFWALVLTFISQSIVIVSFWGLGRSLGIEVGARYYFVILPAVWVVGAVPISIAGLGVVEGGILASFELIGAARAPATALALCQRSMWVLASLPGGFVHLLGAHLPREISVDDEKGVT